MNEGIFYHVCDKIRQFSHHKPVYKQKIGLKSISQILCPVRFIRASFSTVLYTLFAVHDEKIRIHLRELTTNAAKMHS